MIKFSTAPAALKIILMLLVLMFLMNVLAVFITRYSTLDIVRTIISSIILLSIFYRRMAAYYVFCTLITVSLYGTFALMLIRLAETQGGAFALVSFWIATLLIFVPLVIVYRLMGRNEVEASYASKENVQ